MSWRDYYDSYADWFASKIGPLNYPVCKFCGEKFLPNSPNQKYCSYDPDSPECYRERELSNMTVNSWIRAHGDTVKSFIDREGIEVYRELVNEYDNKKLSNNP